MKDKILLGPFKQILTMRNLPLAGKISDDQLEIIPGGGILIVGDQIEKVLAQEEFEKEVNHAKFHGSGYVFHRIREDAVAVPGLIDCHTHMCYAGTRAQDYARRLAGESYLAIAKSGGGMMETVRNTRDASRKELFDSLFLRGLNHLERGVTTCEVKSGYGLNVEAELKMLEIINEANNSRALLPDFVPTCLAAHTLPPEYKDQTAYLAEIKEHLLPEVKKRNLANRVDIYVEEGAFDAEHAKDYLEYAKSLGFECVVHADQFTRSGSEVAAEVGAISADHLESSDDEALHYLKDHNIVAVALPGASFGLGVPFAPVRKMLDMGLSVAIASDWNPGSAPMGMLLIEAAILGAYEKLTIAETMAGITYRAAAALSLSDRGVLDHGKLADFIAFKCDHYEKIIYNQGALRPYLIYRKGKQIL